MQTDEPGTPQIELTIDKNGASSAFFRVTPENVDFGDVVQGTHAVRTVWLFRKDKTDELEIDGIAAKMDSDKMSLGALNAIDNDKEVGYSFDVAVNTDEMVTHPIQKNIQVRLRARSGSEPWSTEEFTIPVHAHIVEDLVSLPAKIIGSIDDGEGTGHADFRLYSRQGKKIIVERPYCDIPDSIVSYNLELGPDCFRLQYPSSVGVARSGFVSVILAGELSFAIPVSLLPATDKERRRQRVEGN